MSSTAASASVSTASLEVGSATVVFLSVVAEVLTATCKVNIRKSWTGKVQGFKTISLRKLSENKTQTLPRYKSYYRSQHNFPLKDTHLLRSRDTTHTRERITLKEWHLQTLIPLNHDRLILFHHQSSLPPLCSKHGIAMPQWPHDEYTRRALTAAGWPQAHPDGSVL